ncbi:uncharacterized protein LOC121741727 [Salvia splendens]|uniref:uncharacterized protein LOC121741727 n=1 Tax=Salvia splendens TaxID=180675 RepID=UPI001C270C89|nr:uncharacterized protein LOC121741727 [Salvia splendens]
MDRNTFDRLCRILYERGGLRIGKVLGVAEQVAMFLGVLAHHTKNRIVGFQFSRSGAIVSYYVNKVLCVVLSLYPMLLAKPTPVTEDCEDSRWKWFKGCLGALDGTHILVLVSSTEKPRYWTRKGQIATNIVAVCDRNMQFVYVLTGCYYYLCDNGYANSNGFLTPFRGVRYHLKEWGPGTEIRANMKDMPDCSCGIGKMVRRTAGKTAMNPGRKYWKCPVGGQHSGSFMWCDERANYTAAREATSEVDSKSYFDQKVNAIGQK